MTKPQTTRKKILLISTGGTLGMQTADGNELNAGRFVEEIFHYAPEAQRLADIDSICPFVMDSSDIGIPQWQTLGTLLYENMDRYDGFVLIHGTDTMSYTASALSYMLVNLPKPVIITGAQRPLAALRTDARGNLLGAIELATKKISEVCIYFNNFLYRGNRTKKINIDGFDAFSSPNFPHLAEVGLNIERGAPSRKPSGLIRLESRFDPRVLALHVFPSMQATYWRGLLDTDLQILIIEAFGSGNIPLQANSVLELVEHANEQKKLVIICSQAPKGTCDLSLYEGGQAAARAGAISAKDMTFEATIVKAMFLLGMFDGDLQRVRNYFHHSIAGEISDEEGILLS